MMVFSVFKKRVARQEMRDFLMAHADALVSGSMDMDSLLAQYEKVTLDQVDSLLILAERVGQALNEVVPSEQFITRLRHELIDVPFKEPHSLWGRIRDLPPRTQLAAGIGGATITAGVLLLATRPVLDVLDNWRSRNTATV